MKQVRYWSDALDQNYETDIVLGPVEKTLKNGAKPEKMQDLHDAIKPYLTTRASDKWVYRTWAWMASQGYSGIWCRGHLNNRVTRYRLRDRKSFSYVREHVDVSDRRVWSRLLGLKKTGAVDPLVVEEIQKYWDGRGDDRTRSIIMLNVPFLWAIHQHTGDTVGLPPSQSSRT